MSKSRSTEHDKRKNEREEFCISFIQSKLDLFEWKRPTDPAPDNSPDFDVTGNGKEYYAEHVDASGIRFEKLITKGIRFDKGFFYYVQLPEHLEKISNIKRDYLSFAEKAIQLGIRNIDFELLENQNGEEALKLFAQVRGKNKLDCNDFKIYQDKYFDFKLSGYRLDNPLADSWLEMHPQWSNNEEPIKAKRKVFDKIMAEIDLGKRSTKKTMLILDSATWKPATSNFEWVDAVILKTKEDVEILKAG